MMHAMSEPPGQPDGAGAGVGVVGAGVGVAGAGVGVEPPPHHMALLPPLQLPMQLRGGRRRGG